MYPCIICQVQRYILLRDWIIYRAWFPRWCQLTGRVDNIRLLCSMYPCIICQSTKGMRDWIILGTWFPRWYQLTGRVDTYICSCVASSNVSRLPPHCFFSTQDLAGKTSQCCIAEACMYGVTSKLPSPTPYSGLQYLKHCRPHSWFALSVKTTPPRFLHMIACTSYEWVSGLI